MNTKGFFALLFVFFATRFALGALSLEEEGALEAYLSSLSEAERISQIFLVNIEGSERYSSPESSRDVLDGVESKPLVPGGMLFFSYNLAPTAEGVMRFTEAIAEYCSANGVLRPYLAIDQEGGDVNRLRGITSALFSPQRVSQNFSPNMAYNLYSAQARQMRALGFDMNLAPVAESAFYGNKDFLGERSFGSEAETCVYSALFVRAYQAEGVSCVPKHFPGNTNSDPHTGLPEIGLSEADLYVHSIVPFFFVLESKPYAVLMSHARTKAIDAGTPACLSEVWVHDILQEKLNFAGLVLSDDIFMAALAENGFDPNRASEMALKAGVDVIMLSEKRFSSVARTLLEKSKVDADLAFCIARAQKKVLAYKIQCGILRFATEGGTLVVRENALEEQLGMGSIDGRLTIFEEAKARGQNP